MQFGIEATVDDDKFFRLAVPVPEEPGKTPGGVEVRAHLRRLVRHIRTRWHNTQITFRGDGHYARPEAMAWCETNGIDYIFGLSGTKPLARKVDEVADDIRTRRAIENLPVLRGYTETRHKAKSWDRERRTVARIEATMLGLDIRFVVTSLDVGSAEWIYDSLYCARGQAENLIKPRGSVKIPRVWSLETPPPDDRRQRR
ncbi:putative transposase [Bradyrhizobium diazoefficiens]|uniref:Putative transposase n=1 Tax=Bradyrhizobium diazoefficiens TaxID=1355477 RepID=A0A0E4BPS2_9BRAD|nr:putative transposase [Bradyrhizobium diazoefficiens]